MTVSNQVCHRCMSADGKHWDGAECWLCKNYPLKGSSVNDKATPQTAIAPARWWSTEQQRWVYPSADAEALARKFHETYERLAPLYGYETRAETREFNVNSPNGRLMLAVCAELLDEWPPQV